MLKGRSPQFLPKASLLPRAPQYRDLSSQVPLNPFYQFKPAKHAALLIIRRSVCSKSWPLSCITQLTTSSSPLNSQSTSAQMTSIRNYSPFSNCARKINVENLSPKDTIIMLVNSREMILFGLRIRSPQLDGLRWLWERQWTCRGDGTGCKARLTATYKMVDN